MCDLNQPLEAKYALNLQKIGDFLRKKGADVPKKVLMCKKVADVKVLM